MSPMTPERWQRLKGLFTGALALPPDERASFLAGACANEEALRIEAEALLASHEKAGGFIEPPAAERPRGRIGPYEIVRELGHGGMGTVVLAVRADDAYRREVAIKVIRRGMDTEDIVRRFRTERQILAGLADPNVAALLDGGTTADGLPYFVMEYVEGEPIDVFCDARRLGVTGRLELFRAVCSAVQYAHRNLVIHRDIKPGNILVTPAGVPKLLDFGLAKILDPSSQGAGATVTQLRILTPAFASPEQVLGGTITTATDVYSLGVLLYVLLSGCRPYGSETTSAEELARAVCETEPPRPSAVAAREPSSAAARGTSSERLRRSLAGDLDTIILKALRKEPERRYTSVEQLSEDLRRHLSGRPVSARSDSLWYRAGKFLGRHGLGTAAAAAVAVLLLVGVWEINRQRVRAERRFNEVRALANTFLFDFHDAIANLPGSTPARELVAKKGLEYIDSLAREVGTDRSLQKELATAYVAVGDVLGRPFFPNLGDTPGALANYRKALALRQALAKADPSDLQARRSVMIALQRVGDTLLKTGDTDGALKNHIEALAIAEALLATNPANPKAYLDVSVSHERIGNVRSDRGENAAALVSFRKSLGAAEQRARLDPANPGARRGLLISNAKVSDQLAATGDLKGSIASCRTSLAVAEELAKPDPTNAQARSDLGTVYGKLGILLVKAGDSPSAKGFLEKRRAIAEALSNADPNDVEAREGVAAAHEDLGDLLEKHGDHGAALGEYARALAAAEAASAMDPGDEEFRAFLAALRARPGVSYAALASRKGFPGTQRRKLWSAARAAFRSSLDQWNELRSRGALTGANACMPGEMAREIARCDTALALTGKGRKFGTTGAEP